MKRSLAALALVVVPLAAACGTTTPITSSATIGGGNQTGGTSGDLTSGTTGGSTSGGTTGATSGVLSSSTGGGSSTSGTTGGGSSTSGTTGGGSSTSGTTGGGSSTSGTTGVVSAPTGPRNTSPLKVGIVTTDIGAAVKALGGGSGSNKHSDDGYKALINAINKSGGLAGRKIVPTYSVVNALDTSYQSDATQICAAMGDAKVELVISDAASTDYGFAQCLAKQNIPMITSVASDAQSQGAIPALFNAFNPTFDRGYGAVVDSLVGSGYVTPKSKIGVVRITCPAIERAYKNTVLPRMRAAHLATPQEYTVSCAAGFQDAGSFSAAMRSAVLKFRTASIDRVFVIGPQENLLLQYFAEQAQNQQYHPGYALSASSVPITLIDASTFPQEQLPQVHGVGWHPASDTNTNANLPQERRCIALSTAGGLKPANITEVFALYDACSNLFLAEAAAKKGTGLLNSAALRGTIPTLGTSFASTGITSGATKFGPGRQDGVELSREWAFNKGCTCFRYIGAPKVMR